MFALLLSGMLIVVAGVLPRGANAQVTAVTGSAYGYFTRVALFGGPAADRPCTNPPTNTTGCAPGPAVTLPPGGSTVPVTASAATGDARYGPGIIFTSGPITVSTQGTPGPTGSVTSSTSIQAVNTSGQETFTAATLSSTCTASETGRTGSTTIGAGTLRTDDGDATHPEVVVAVPANPAPNTMISGRIRSVGDTFTYIFNEQTVNPDGSLTVNAAHQLLLGPTAIGDAIIGQSKCGVTAVPTTTTTLPATTTTRPATTTTTLPTTTTTTLPTTTTTTLPTTTTTTLPTTTTTLPATTTTTLPTTTTTLPATTTTTRPSTTTTLPSTTTTLPTTTTTMGSTSTSVVPPNERECRGVAATIVGTDGDDDIVGTPGDDVIVGSAGNDRILGLGGDDLICGGAGNDRLVGGSGADRIFGGDGIDTIAGDAGADDLIGGDGDDTIRGGEGDDKLDGRNGSDTCRAGAGTDVVLNCEF